MKHILKQQLTVLATLAEMQLFESAALTYAKRELQHKTAAHEHNALLEYAINDQHGISKDVCRVSCLTCGARITVTRAELRPLLDDAPEHVKAAWEIVQNLQTTPL